MPIPCRALALILFFVAPLSLTTPVHASEEPTCSKTTERVIKPFLTRLKAATDGQAYHGEKTAARVKKTSKFITDLQATQVKFDEKRKKDQDNFTKRIDAAQQAIADITAKHTRRISDLQGAATAAAAVDNEREVDRLVKAIASENATYSAGKKSIYAPIIGRSNSTSGWREFIAKESAKASQNASAHASGTIGIYLPLVGRTLTWQGVLELIDKEKGKLAHTTARKDGFYLPTLGRTLTGEGIDDSVAKGQNELADANARINAGTFALYVPSFGRTVDRNYAQAEMDKAQAELAATRAGWDNGKYTSYNPKAGRTLSKGDIDKMIADAEKDLADYIAAGDDAKAYVPKLGRTTSGTLIRKAIAQANTPEAKARLQQHYGYWRDAFNGVIEAKRAKISKLEDLLDAHRDLWITEIKARQDRIDGHYTRALAETPCGGSSSGLGSVGSTTGSGTNMPPLADGTPGSDPVIGDTTIVKFPETPPADPEKAGAWLNLKKRCTDLDHYRKSKDKKLKASVGEYLAYLRVLEKRNPTHNWKRIISKLHADFYGYDLHQTIPVFKTPLFLHGADTKGFETVDSVCRVKVGEKWVPYSPKFVYLASGEEVDIAHVYAGPRSDMNRDGHYTISLDLLLMANTYAGDLYQVFFDSYTKFPHNQLRGDVMGIWMAQFYRLPRNQNVPFSEAMAILLEEIGTKVGGYSQVARPQ